MGPVQYPVLLLGSLLFFGTGIAMAWYFRKDPGSFDAFSVGFSYKDLYGFLTVIIPLIAGTAYLMMSLGFGSVTLDGRTFFWFRYFEWIVTTPLLILGVLVLTQRGGLTAVTMVTDYLMVLFAFGMALTQPPVSTVLFLLSVSAFLVLIRLLFYTSNRAIQERPATTQVMFRRLRNLFIILWTAYFPFLVVTTDGLGMLTFMQSTYAFMVLDLATKIGFACLVAISLGRIQHLDAEMPFDE